MNARPADPSSVQAQSPGQVQAVFQVAADLARSTQLGSALDAALETVLAALDLPIGGIYVLDEASGDLRATPHHRGVPPEHLPAISHFHRGEAFVGRALDGEEPWVVTDLSAMPEARDAARKMGLRTVVFVPLHARGRAVGVMPLGGLTVRAFGEDDLRLLGAVGGMLGVAIHSARLTADARRHLAQMRSLSELDRAIVEDRELPSVLEVIAREAALLAGGDSALVLAEGERDLAVVAAHGAAARRALGSPPSLAGRPMLEWLRAPGPHLVELADSRREAAMVVPLQVGSRMLGGLVLLVPPDRTEAGDLEALGAFGQRAAAAVAKTRARDAEGRRAGQLALLAAAAEIAASTLDVERLLDSIARYIQRSFGYYSVAVYLVDPEQRAAFMAGAAGTAAGALPKGHRMNFGTGLIGWVSEHGQYVLANDVRKEPRFVSAPMHSTRSELVVPVRLMGEVVAIINVESDKLGAFDEGDVVAVDGIAAQVAASIRNARLFEEKVRALRSLEILQEITNVLNSDLDLQALLERIARRSVDAVHPAQRGAVLLFDEDTLRVRSSFGYDRPEALEAVRLAFHEGLAGSVFVSGQGRLVASTAGDHGRFAAAFREAAGGALPTSALCVPIALPQEKLGVLLLESVAAKEAFDVGDLRFATTLAHHAAIAIGNALHLRRLLAMDRQRQEYLSNVSHELRTPLTVIQGYVEALAGLGLPDVGAQYVQVAHQQCQRLTRLIDEVLEVSRLEQGIAQRPVDWAPVQMGDVLHRVVQALRAEAAVKEIRLLARITPDLPVLAGDERLLHLLATNLVENAIKFTQAGGTVEVALEAGEDQLVLRVRDDGIGLAPEDHERIFEKFFVVDGAFTRTHGGAGIGLYLAREVANVHDGSIRVESALGQGASFEVRLPLRPAR
jgi:signal transduction histidine kinase